MKIYSLLKLAGGNRIPARVKILGLAVMQMFGRRVTGVFIDPVMACNLRCKMCYFSDAEKRKEISGGVMTELEIRALGRAVFPYALKLQIGCAAEPTLWPEEKLVSLIKLGREYGIPYISLTSNGQRIASNDINLMRLVSAGLDELTLSMHGTTEEIYETLMPGASYERLKTLLEIIKDVKQRYPDFKLRINFTVNSLNVTDLASGRFEQLMPDGIWPDILQIRPVQKLGNTEWTDFSHKRTKELYASTIQRLADECKRRQTICIVPSLDEIDAVASSVQESASAVIEDFTYCYVAPNVCYKSDFKPEDEDFRQYHKRKHTVRAMLSAAINPKHASHRVKSTKKLNYHVK